MIDTHYDLLSIAYVDYLNNNFDRIKKYTDEIRSGGVTDVFANLYFLSIDEMKYELHDNYYNGNVLSMFKTARDVLEYYGYDINFIYSIEGCDYLEISDLDNLYKEGLRSILLVWNNENKYGSGNKTNKGLTECGKKFLNKAISLGIGIDFSHANDETFFDMVNVIKENKESICYASHSNARALHNISRNLSDEQILELKNINGSIGVISNRFFLDDNDDKRKEYLNHIIYISNLIGIDNVMLSTDDMRFLSHIDPEYIYRPIYTYDSISYEIKNDLSKVFNDEEVDKILYKNARNVVRRLKK